MTTFGLLFFIRSMNGFKKFPKPIHRMYKRNQSECGHVWARFNWENLIDVFVILSRGYNEEYKSF